MFDFNVFKNLIEVEYTKFLISHVGNALRINIILSFYFYFELSRNLLMRNLQG